jgi:hypothetical protein
MLVLCAGFFWAICAPNHISQSYRIVQDKQDRQQISTTFLSCKGTKPVPYTSRRAEETLTVMPVWRGESSRVHHHKG